MLICSKPKTFGKERNNKGSSAREQEGKQHWLKSVHVVVATASP
jgi:hypothetical protein